MDAVHGQLSRYAIFEAADEAEALRLLLEAYSGMYHTSPELVGFSEDGYLKSTEPSASLFGRSDGGEEYEDETIYLSSFEVGSQLLIIELYDERSDPGNPLHEDNILLARHLERLCQK